MLFPISPFTPGAWVRKESRYQICTYLGVRGNGRQKNWQQGERGTHFADHCKMLGLMEHSDSDIVETFLLKLYL